MANRSKLALSYFSSLLVATTVVMPHVAAAEAPADADSTAPAAEPEALQEIVVSARQRSERLLDVPVAVTAVNPDEIRQYNLTSVANIKIVAPQISLDRGFTGSGTSISMRGVSSSSLDAGVEQSVLLVFDGMAMSRGRI